MPNTEDKVRIIKKLKTASSVQGTPQAPEAAEEKFTFHCLKVRLSLDKTGSSLYVIGPRLTVGREKCDISLNHSSISEKHCRFSEEEGVLFLEDLGSRIGTFVNGLRLKPGRTVILQEGDVVVLGQVETEILLKREDEIPKLRLAERSLFSGGPPAAPVAPTAPTAPVAVTAPVSVPLEEKPPVNLSPPPVPEQTKERAPRPELKRGPRPKLEPKKELQKEPEKEPEKESKHQEDPKTLGIPLRVIALAGDLVLTWALAYNFLNHPQYHHFQGELKSLLGKIIFWVPNPLASLYLADKDFWVMAIPFFLLFSFLQMTANFVLGASLAQASLGIGGGSSFIWNRLGGCIRSSIGLLTGPFLVGDLPCLVGKRSFKEWLSMAPLQFKGTRRALVSFCLLIPPFFLFCLLAPVLFLFLKANTGLPLKIKVSSTPVVPALERPVSSRHFQFTLEEPQVGGPLDSFVFLPSFDITKGPSFRKIRPVMEIYDKKRNIKGEFRAVRFFPLQHLLKGVQERNRFFRRGYPHLDRYLRGPADAAGPTETVQREIRELFQDSFFLHSFSRKKNLSELAGFLLKNGPFIQGHLYLYERLLRPLEGSGTVTGRPKADILSLSGHPFLRLTREGAEDKSRQKFLFPLGTFRGLFYQMTWENSHRTLSRASEEDFTRHFLQKLQWNFTGPQEVGTAASVASADFAPSILPVGKTREERLRQLSIFHVIDHFALRTLKGEDRALLEDYIYHYFFDLGRMILNNHKTLPVGQEAPLKKWPLPFIRKFQDVAKVVGENQKEQEKIPFIRHMEQLEEAIKKADFKFFELSSV